MGIFIGPDVKISTIQSLGGWLGVASHYRSHLPHDYHQLLPRESVQSQCHGSDLYRSSTFQQSDIPWVDSWKVDCLSRHHLVPLPWLFSSEIEGPRGWHPGLQVQQVTNVCDQSQGFSSIGIEYSGNLLDLFRLICAFPQAQILNYSTKWRATLKSDSRRTHAVRLNSKGQYLICSSRNTFPSLVYWYESGFYILWSRKWLSRIKHGGSWCSLTPYLWRVLKAAFPGK